MLLRRLAGPGQGDGVVRRRVALAELAALPDPRVRGVRGPVWRPPGCSPCPTVTSRWPTRRCSASWPRLREWLAEDATARDVQRRLTSAVGRLGARRTGTPPCCGPVRGCRRPADLVARAPEELTGAEVAFVEASTARLDAERAEAEERARTAQRQNTRLRRLLAGLGITLAVALVAGPARGRVAGARPQAQRRTATAQRLAATALSEDYLAERMLTAVEAVRTEESPQTVGALLSVLDGSSAALQRWGPGIGCSTSMPQPAGSSRTPPRPLRTSSRWT